MEGLAVAIVVVLCAVHAARRLLALLDGPGPCGHCDGCPKRNGRTRCDTSERKERNNVV